MRCRTIFACVRHFYVWQDSCETWLMCDMTYVWHDSCVAWLTYKISAHDAEPHDVCECVVLRMNESCHMYMSHVTYVWHDTIMCDMILHDVVTHLHVTWLIHMWCDSSTCDMTHSMMHCRTTSVNMSCYVWMSHVTCIWVMSHMCDMTQSCVTWLTYESYHACVTWRNHVWHDSLIRCSQLMHCRNMSVNVSCYVWMSPVTRIWAMSRMWDMTHPCVTRLNYKMFAINALLHEIYAFVRHDSVTCVTWIISVCDMTHSYVWYDSCVTWIMCDMAHV